MANRLARKQETFLSSSEFPGPEPATPNESVDDLVQSVARGAQATATLQPFFHFEVPSFLPQQRYEELRRTFPSADRFPEIIVGDKKRLSSRTSRDEFASFCRDNPVWGQFFDDLASPPFQDTLRAIVGRSLIQARGFFGGRPWRLEGEADSMLKRICHQDSRLTFEFSRLEAGSYVQPHTDAPKKLLTLILYFPDPSWRKELGGGTYIYRPRDPALQRNWFNHFVSFEDVEPIRLIQFEPNALVGFVKSAASYHGVLPITCPAGMARTSLNINIFQRSERNPIRVVKIGQRLAGRFRQRYHER